MKKLIGKLSLIFLLAVILFPIIAANRIVEAGTNTTLVDNMKKKSRQFFTMKDANGKPYTVYIFSNNEKKKVTGRDHTWAGASEGDIWYTGDYQMALQDKSLITLQTQSVKGYEFNYTRKMIYVIPSKSVGQPDILSFSTTECSNCREARMYYIKNGQIEKVKVKTDGEISDKLFYTEKPKVVSKNLYQSVTLTNAEDPGAHFNTYSFNPKNGVMTLTKTKSYLGYYADAKWRPIYDKWRSDPNYIVK